MVPFEQLRHTWHGIGSTVALACMAYGCHAWVPTPYRSGSVGTTSNGILLGGHELPDSGPGFLRFRPGEPTRWGTESLVALVRGAAATLQEPGEASTSASPLVVGDMSFPGGGAHPRHRSHQSGRDVDLVYFAKNDAGQPSVRHGFIEFGRFGVNRSGPAHLAFFDTARNWALIKALLTNRDALVEWLFCSRAVKRRLLHYAAAREPDRRLVHRAAHVMHQPTDGESHDDHVHVRVTCTAQDLALGCRTYAPRFPWRPVPAIEQFVDSDAGRADAELLQFLLDDDIADNAAAAAAAVSTPATPLP